MKTPVSQKNCCLATGDPGKKKTGITQAVNNIFLQTCTIELYTHNANNPYQKRRIDKISRPVPFLIAGHILLLNLYKHSNSCPG